MPHSADLTLKLSYETGTKTIETKGGASLSNTIWKPPLWNDLAPWELSESGSDKSSQKLAHSSRRIWDLSFSFLDKTNTFPKYNALNRYTNQSLSDTDLLLTNEETLMDSDDFFSRVWNIVGSHSPCIFQPDTDANEFAIVKIVGNSLKISMVANYIYTIKIKLRECW